MAAISQWPGVVSLAGDARAQLPYAPAGGGSGAGERQEVAGAGARQVRQLDAANAGAVAQRIAARVAVLRGIGHFADTYAVENDPDYAGKRHNSTVTSVRATAGMSGSNPAQAASSVTTSARALHRTGLIR